MIISMVTVLLMDVASPEPILTLPKQISEVLLQKMLERWIVEELIEIMCKIEIFEEVLYKKSVKFLSNLVFCVEL